MPRNVYFSHGTRSEQWLVEDLIIEALKIYGHEIIYLPRKIVNEDKIFSEDIYSKFGKAFFLEAYVENIEGYGGDGVLMSKFGLQIRDQMTVLVSKRRWEQLVQRFNTDGKVPRPAEGDLIYFPMGNALMEIKFVENKAPFYQLQNLPTYRLSLEMFEYSGEDIDTGMIEIDDIQLIKGAPVELTLNSITGKFEIGEYVECYGSDSQTILTAEVKTQLPGKKLVVVNIQTESSNIPKFIGNSIRGVSSGAYGTVVNIDSFSQMNSTDPSAQNDIFEKIGDEIIDFSEINPFGEANYKSL